MSDFISGDACVWFEIPVTDMARAKAFYEAVVQAPLTDQEEGPNPMSVFATATDNAVSGHIYPGKPAGGGNGPTIHLAVPEPLEEAMERATANGDTVVSPVITIPAGRFAYCLDPDGNSIGLFTR